MLIPSTARASDLRKRPLHLLACAQASGPGWALRPMGTRNVPIDDYATINSTAFGRLGFEQTERTPMGIRISSAREAEFRAPELDPGIRTAAGFWTDPRIKSGDDVEGDDALGQTILPRRLILMPIGRTPADIDVVQIHDAFTVIFPMALEDYGFCAHSEGSPFITTQNLSRPAGGLPAKAAGGPFSEAHPHGLNLVVEGARRMRGPFTCHVEGASTGLVISGGGGGHNSAANPGR